MQNQPIQVSFYDLTEIEEMFDTAVHIKSESKVLIAEQILISIYNPPGNKKDKT
jgi:hypothetical protein